MMNDKHSTIIAVFPTLEQAETAVGELLQKGFTEQEVGLVLNGETDFQTTDQAKEYGEQVVKRTTTGAVIGGVLSGALGTLAAIALPGVGTILGAGLIAASGAIVGGFTGLMSTMGLTDDQVDWYRAELEAGRPLVVVQTNGRYSEALAILQTHGAYDATREEFVSEEDR